MTRPAYARRSRKRATQPCPCGCGQLGLCAGHRERLAPIRESLVPQLRNGAKYTIKGSRGTPRCVNPACGQPRVSGEAFCWECQRAGHTEEVD